MKIQLMINWDEKKIYCETCNKWIAASAININGTHDMELGINDPSHHVLWEKVSGA